MKYSGNDNYGHPKQDYLDKLAGMTDEKLVEETERMIWLSAYANNNPRSDYHWQARACHDEADKRGKVDEIYVRAYNQARREAGC